MIKIFKTNGVLQIAIIVAAVVAIWIGSFVKPVEMAEDGMCGPVYRLIAMGLAGLPTVSTLVALLLTLTEGYLLNRLLYKKGLIPLNTLMPLLMYVIVSGIGVRSCGMRPEVVANLWLMLALMSMMPKENMIMEEGRIFNTGLWCSMAVLTWIPSVYVLVPIAIGQITYKMYKGREWAVSLLGLMAPIIIVLTAMFMTDEIGETAEYAKTLASELGVRYDGGGWSIAETAVLAVFAIATTVGTVTLLFGKTVVQRKHGMVFVSLLIFSVASMFYGNLMPVDGEPFAIVLATTGSIFLIEKKKRLWIYDIVIAAMFLTSLFL